MAEGIDCAEARALLQRLLVGAAGEDEIEPALRHLAGCEECRALFELRDLDPFEGTEDEMERSEQPEEVAQVEIAADPAERIERALVSALEREPIMRERAAAALAATERITPATLERLAGIAAEHPDRDVRESALTILDRLDEAVSIPERVIAAWAAAPAEAAPFLEGVLARLAGPAAATRRGMAGLARSAPAAKAQEVELAGPGGLRGRLYEAGGELRLALEGVPPEFERSQLTIVLPGALREGAPVVRWSGEPGLVRADRPVSEGHLEVTLGRVSEAGSSAEELVERIYLLNPKARRKRR